MSNRYLGKMLLKVDPVTQEVTGMAWLHSDGGIPLLATNEHRHLYVVDRFENDTFPENWGSKNWTLQEFMSWIQKAKITPEPSEIKPAIAEKYPQYYKDVSQLDFIDVYAVHQLFNINDPSGAIQHASKKLLLSGVRTGNKSFYEDIKEARDTLNRYLEMHHDAQNIPKAETTTKS